ncbi:type I pullulanase [Enterococcus saccharolyticus]|uniref:type I pullulanase n=1 Tax=Enterococcus TaxID=1350 RepID=UPI00137A079F|nr:MULTISPECIES: type I pullulanase [Enterococcus]MCD5002986.1 type I pullulanase [Enterococcus saccharolyticus]
MKNKWFWGLTAAATVGAGTLILRRTQKHSANSITKKLATLEAQAYDGSDLGLHYTPEQSKFKLWAPDAQAVRVRLYQTGDAHDDSLIETYAMTKHKNVWQVDIPNDLEGLFYTYEIVRGNQTVETVDLYAKAVGIDGNRAAIIDMDKTNPEGWQTTQPIRKSMTDAYIWEVHVADFSASPTSGVTAENRGKYLAFTEKETTLNGEGKIATGVAYLKELGVTHVHLLPAFDSDNHELATDYNWGYDPKNYNVPEGRYASDATNPYVRIKEFKQMVQSLHEENIGVILDVVYNHTSLTEHSWFNLTVPDYYYRQDKKGQFADGSACGNEVASERAMVRKYMIDSIIYWAEEYQLDGFRFDLMGLHDVETMNQIRQALDNRGLSYVLMYGEPWDAGSNQIKAPNLPANKKNVSQLSERIAVFNDDLRDSLKGYVFEESDGAFVQGQNGKRQSVRTFFDSELEAGIKGMPLSTDIATTGWSKASSQVIAYISAHDNLSLWDKLVATTGATSYERNEELVMMNKLAAVVLFTSQGGIFTQAGEEFARTKFGDENSYVSALEINQLNWQQVADFNDLIEFYKGMWQIRQHYAPLRDGTDETAQTMIFLDKTENLLAYVIPNTHPDEKWRQLLVIVNSSYEEQEIELPTEENITMNWQIVADNDSAGIEPKGRVDGSTIAISAQSVCILVDSE